MLIRKFWAIRIFFFGEHDDARFGEVELVHEKVFHALGVVDATLQFVPGVFVRNADDHRLLAAVSIRRGARRCVVVGGRGRVRRRWRRVGR